MARPSPVLLGVGGLRVAFEDGVELRMRNAGPGVTHAELDPTVGARPGSYFDQTARGCVAQRVCQEFLEHLSQAQGVELEFRELRQGRCETNAGGFGPGPEGIDHFLEQGREVQGLSMEAKSTSLGERKGMQVINQAFEQSGLFQQGFQVSVVPWVQAI